VQCGQLVDHSIHGSGCHGGWFGAAGLGHAQREQLGHGLVQTGGEQSQPVEGLPGGLPRTSSSAQLSRDRRFGSVERIPARGRGRVAASLLRLHLAQLGRELLHRRPLPAGGRGADRRPVQNGALTSDGKGLLGAAPNLGLQGDEAIPKRARRPLAEALVESLPGVDRLPDVLAPRLGHRPRIDVDQGQPATPPAEHSDNNPTPPRHRPQNDRQYERMRIQQHPEARTGCGRYPGRRRDGHLGEAAVSVRLWNLRQHGRQATAVA
jgi:hypothetical protein